MQVSLIIFISFSTAEQYPKLVNGPPPERRRVGKDLHMLSSYVFKVSQTVRYLELTPTVCPESHNIF